MRYGIILLGCIIEYQTTPIFKINALPNQYVKFYAPYAW